MKDVECVEFLQWALPQLQYRWPGFRKVRRQVCRRIVRRCAELGLGSMAAYRAYLASHPEEWAQFDTACRITISRFYRDRGVFDLIRTRVLPELAQAAQQGSDGQLRAWSAGCASGEEPYTLSIVWRLFVQTRFPQVHLRILASDLEPQTLERARRGCYPPSSLKELAASWRQQAFVENGGEYCLRSEFRENVQFVRSDLRECLPAGLFHLIFCRHLVFTYFDEPQQQRLLETLVRRLAPGGFLITGKQEALPTQPAELTLFAPHSGIYRKRA